MRIQNNIAAMTAHRNMSVANAGNARSQEKLASGLRINRAGDDAAGLSISEKMRGQIRGLNQASRNAQDGISLIQTAEGALNETQNILQRMRELSVQAANDTNTLADRDAISAEIAQLFEEIDRIAETTQFNEMNLLDGSFGCSGPQLNSVTLTQRIDDVLAALTGADGALANFNATTVGTFSGTSFTPATGTAIPDAVLNAAFAAIDLNNLDIPAEVRTAIGNATSFDQFTTNIANALDATTPPINEAQANAALGVINDAMREAVVTAVTNMVSGAAGRSIDALQSALFNLDGEQSAALFGSAPITIAGSEANGGFEFSFTLGGPDGGTFGQMITAISTQISAPPTIGVAGTNGNGLEPPTPLQARGNEVRAAMINALQDLTTSNVGAFVNNEGDAVWAAATEGAIPAALLDSLMGDITWGNGIPAPDDAATFAEWMAEIEDTAADHDAANSILSDIMDAMNARLEEAVHELFTDLGNPPEAPAAGSVEAAILALGGTAGATALFGAGEITAEHDASGFSFTATIGTGEDQMTLTELRLAAAAAIHAPLPGGPPEPFTTRSVNGGGGGGGAGAGAVPTTAEIQLGNAERKFHIGANSGQQVSIAIADSTVNALFGAIGAGASTPIAGAAVARNENMPASERILAMAQFSQGGENISTGNREATFAEAFISAITATQGFAAIGTGSFAADTSFHVTASDARNLAMQAVDDAIAQVSQRRSDLGAVQNRLEHTIRNLDVASENLLSAEARIRDVDMASEVMEQTRTNILQQAAQSMLAMANQQPQSVLQLLG